jgi:hypothetical protein
MRKLNTGIKSGNPKDRPQDSQCERGVTTDRFLGIRSMHTFRKLPTVSPSINKGRMKPGIQRLYTTGVIQE